MNTEKYNCYRYERPKKDVSNNIEYQVDIKRFRHEPKILKRMIYNSIVSGFKQQVFSISDEMGLVHFSFVIGKCHKFGFLTARDYEIGPCWTREDKRGQGIYAKMINYIGKYYTDKDPNSNIYILIRDTNASSLKGVFKSYYRKIGFIEKTPFLKWYSIIHEDCEYI